jgi:WD40 repeat protein
LNFSPNGRALAFGENFENGNESKISFLNAQSLEEEYRNAPPRIEGKCHFLGYSSDGTKLVGVAESEDHTCEVRIWDASKGQLLKSIPCFPPTKAPIAISPNGETFAVARESGVEIYDLNSLKLISSIDDKSRAYGTSFAPDGQSLAIGRGNGLVVVHETSSVTNQSKFGLDHPHIEQIAYSPQGDRLVAVYRGQLTILSVPDYKILCSLPAPADTAYFRNVEFSPDGRILAAIRCDKGGNEQVILWDSRLPGI